MSLSITCKLGNRDQKNGLPVGGLRIAVNGERIHRFDPADRPAEARQEWGPEYVGIYPDMDLGILLSIVAEVVEWTPNMRQQEVSLCECSFDFVFDRLDETYVRLAAQQSHGDTNLVPAAQRGYLVTNDSLAEEIVAVTDQFISKVSTRETSDADAVTGLQSQRDNFVEEVMN